jgi:hypothetical protein
MDMACVEQLNVHFTRQYRRRRPESRRSAAAKKLVAVKKPVCQAKEEETVQVQEGTDDEGDRVELAQLGSRCLQRACQLCLNPPVDPGQSYHTSHKGGRAVPARDCSLSLGGERGVAGREG